MKPQTNVGRRSMRFSTGAFCALLFLAAVFVGCSKTIIEDEAPGQRSALIRSGEGAWTGVTGGTIPPEISCQYSVDPTKTYSIMAGQTIGSGTLTITNDNENLYLKVCGVTWQDVDANLKLWVGVSGDLVPAYIDGNPIPGQFPIQFTVPSGAENAECFYVTVPFTSIEAYTGSAPSCSSSFVVYMHGDVVANGSEQTAWAGDCKVDPGKKGGGGKWYRYVCGYQAACCTLQPPVNPCDPFTQTAFAYGTHVFTKDRKSNPANLPSLNLTMNRWGWAINLKGGTAENPVVYESVIHAGAGLNQINKGEAVGTLRIEWDGSSANITYNLDGGFEMSGLHLYASDLKPTTIAPGRYGNTVSFDPMATSHTFTNYALSDGNGDGVWFIAHAGVFGVFGPCPTQ